VSGPYRSLKGLKDKASVRVADEAEDQKKRAEEDGEEADASDDD
jgi:hypothetical protein